MNSINKTLARQRMVFGLHYQQGEFFFSFHAESKTYAAFESQFYTQFNDFQMVADSKKVRETDMSRTVIGEIQLENKSYFPIKVSDHDDTEFIFDMFRAFESFDVVQDKFSLFRKREK